MVESGASKEFRVAGPPGTGKTTWLAKQIALAVERYGPNAVMATSFTKAAAIEIAGRELPVDSSKVGTLHAICYRALGKAPIAEKQAKEWNERERVYRITGDMPDIDDPYVERELASFGDGLYREYSLLRGKMVARDKWPQLVRRFASRWEAWKKERGYVDFPDMIEMALRELPVAPGNPVVLMVDEAQDMTPAQISLVRRWSQSQGLEMLVLVGDGDQTIYSFAGADPSVLLTPLPDSQKRALLQSYRVPRQVHKLAQGWIDRSTLREPITWRPRDAEGEVKRLGISRNAPEFILEELQPYLRDGKTVMYLATSGYMLQPMIQLLREEGLPFWNPYRRNQGAWNPLRSGKGSMGEKMLAFMRFKRDRLWTYDEINLWIPLLSSERVLRRGAKKAIEAFSGDEIVNKEWFEGLFQPQSLPPVMAGNLDWFAQNVVASEQHAMKFPLQVIQKRGPEALENDPQIIISTVHACKGGEADVVCLSPDLSPAAAAEWENPATTDNVRRVFYVGMTRAKESLLILEPNNQLNVELQA